MRASQVFSSASILFVCIQSAHASTSDHSARGSRLSNESGRRKRTRKKRTSARTEKDLLPVLPDSSFWDNPFNELGNEDEERLLSALERIDNDEQEERNTRQTTKPSPEDSAGLEAAEGMAAPNLKTADASSATRLSSRSNPPVQHQVAREVSPPTVSDSVPRSHQTYQQRGSNGQQYPLPQPQMPSHLSTQQHQRVVDGRTAMLSYTTPWVIKFLQGRPKDALVPVPRDFLADGFNLVHLPPLIERLNGSTDASFPLYKAALRVILSNQDLTNVNPTVQRAAEVLYTFVHQRYITSPRGLDTVRRLLLHDNVMFGKCPRPACRGMPLLPHGESCDYGGHAAQRYCCACGQAWEFWDSLVDGSAWGRSFCHLYLLTYGTKELGRIPQGMPIPIHHNPTPTVFGFKIHTAALRRLHEP